MKRWLLPAIKALISICLLGWFFTLVEPGAVLEILGRASWAPLSLAVAAMLVGLLVSVVKWQRLLRCDGIAAGRPELIRYYLIGVYCNNFLPTSIGGDAMRAWLVARRYGHGAAGVASVLAERLSGLLALLLVAGVLSVGGTLFAGQTWLGWALLLSVPVLLLAAALAGRGQLLRLLPTALHEKLGGFFVSLGKYRSDRGLWLVMAWTSAVYPLLVALVYYWGGRALGIEVPVLDLAVVTSLVTLLTLVPLSLNGLGIREGGFVFFLGQLGIPRAEALSLSLLVFGLTLLFSLVGGLCFLFGRD